MLPRVLEPETLDHLAPDDPVAQRSRRDLRRVNAFMGARRILARAMARAAADAPARPLRILAEYLAPLQSFRPSSTRLRSPPTLPPAGTRSR